MALSAGPNTASIPTPEYYLLAERKQNELFPGGIEADFQQGGAGDCYAFAGVDALVHNPLGRWAVLDLFVNSPTGPGGWDVRFPDEPHPEGITQTDLNELQAANKALRSAPLGYLLLQRAYARLINRRESPEMKTIRVSPDPKKLDMAFEGGHSHEFFKDTCGANRVNSSILALSEPKNATVLTVADERDVFALATLRLSSLEVTPSWNLMSIPERMEIQRLIRTHDATSQRNPSFQYPVLDSKGRKRYLHGRHAYSIRRVDARNRQVLIANPHDTKKDQFWMTFDQVQQFFGWIYQGTLESEDFESRSEFPKFRRRFDPTVPATVASMVTNFAGIVAERAMPEDVDASKHTEKPKSKTGEVVSGYNYSPAGEVMRKIVFEGDHSTGEVQGRFVDLFIKINKAPVGRFFYYDALGQTLLEVDLPDELKAIQARDRGEYEKALQNWHNENRKKLLGKDAVCPENFKLLGYPFVGTSTPPKADEGDTGDPEANPTDRAMINVVMTRLQETTESGNSSPVYFGGKTTTIFEAIKQMTDAYEVPLAIALGLAANESGYDQDAISNADARGIFQFTKGGFEDAKAWANAHPELSRDLRTGTIGDFENSWKNRFVSAEMFCAYYRRLSETLKNPITEFENKLREMDPTFPVGSLQEIGVINAYNAGEGTIQNAIKRFLLLDEKAMQEKLGKPPYGVDAWLAMLSYSFGLSDNGKSSQVGLHVFTYPQKVLALGALIRDEQNYLSRWSTEKPAASLTDSFDGVDVIPNPSKKGVTLGLKATAVATGVVAVASVVRDTRAQVSRRGFFKNALLAGAAASSIATPFVEALPGQIEEAAEKLEHRSYPPDPQVLLIAKGTLDDCYDDLLAIYKSEGKTGWTKAEHDATRDSLIEKQRILMEAEFRQMMGDDLFNQFIASKGLPLAKRISLYEKIQERQEAYIADQKAKGNLVAFPANDPNAPFFAEQVGKNSGTDNDADCLFMNKEFEWIIPTIIELVNYQVDKFNANPELYGIKDPNFPVLPHISAVKISGALRYVKQTITMLKSPALRGRTTQDASVHWLGSAIDEGSYATEGGHMVRLKEDLKESKNGAVVVKGGELLPNGGFGKRTRDIYSMMMGRAMFAMMEPAVNEKGVVIAPLLEPGQVNNWHTVIKSLV